MIPLKEYYRVERERTGLRQRRVKNLEQKIADNSKYLIENPADAKGNWQRIFKNDNPVYAEFGCGRGKFLLDMAEKYTERNFVGFEGRGSIIIRALEKALIKAPENLFFVCKYILDVRDYFEKNELSGLYLNFNVPWHRRRHASRRLTHRDYLSGYREVLKEGSFIEFKTDSPDLYSFSVNEFNASRMNLVESTNDLHNSGLEAGQITTEYEDSFLSEGNRIHYLKIMV